ncbi:TonB family protein [Acidithiobacillus sp.]|uniref:TonB family protein n=1 Tax=Acidithiobacillus sp. TaxID=1872118 RepID=UPI00345DE609
MRHRHRGDLPSPLTPSGHLLSAHVAQSSGIGAINRAALNAVGTASYPPFRKKMPKQDMTFNVRVHLSAQHSWLLRL